MKLKSVDLEVNLGDARALRLLVHAGGRARLLPLHQRRDRSHVRGGAGPLIGLGIVPLQDPDLAAKELAHIKSLGFPGVELGSNVNGKSLGMASSRASSRRPSGSASRSSCTRSDRR